MLQLCVEIKGHYQNFFTKSFAFHQSFHLLCRSPFLSLYSFFFPSLFPSPLSLSAHTFSSGMAAVSTVMQALLKSGDHIVSVNDVYGGVNRFFRKVASGFNISVTLVDATNTSNVENAIKDNTKVRESGEDGREREEGGRGEGEEREKVSLQVYIGKVCHLIVCTLLQK